MGDNTTTEYVIPERTREQLDNNFTYHAPISDQPARYVEIRDKAKELAYLICSKTPVSREQSLALTNLEQAIFWANAAIARNEREGATNNV